jgi:phosphopantetheine adenylyltransferase
LDVVSIDLVLAEDGKRISSTRIRAGEIDAQGNLVA